MPTTIDTGFLVTGLVCIGTSVLIQLGVLLPVVGRLLYSISNEEVVPFGRNPKVTRWSSMALAMLFLGFASTSAAVRSILPFSPETSQLIFKTLIVCSNLCLAWFSWVSLRLFFAREQNR